MHENEGVFHWRKGQFQHKNGLNSIKNAFWSGVCYIES